MFIFLPAIPWQFYTQRPQHLCKALAKKGETVLYLCPTIDRSLLGDSINESPQYRLRPILPDIYELLILVDEVIDIHQMILPETSAAQISKALRVFSCFQPVLFFQHPAWVSLMSDKDATDKSVLLDLSMYRVVYDCMDDIESFPNAPQALLRDAEIALLNKSEKVFVTANKLKGKLSAYLSDGENIEDNPSSDKITLIPNAVSLPDFLIPEMPSNPDRNGKNRSVGYIGSLRSWFDMRLIEYLLSAIPDINITLVGKLEADFKYQLHDRLITLGERSYSDLPGIMSGFQTCLIPFLKTPLTEATDPVKLYEYFALGKPVVATRLPELLKFSDLAYLADSHDEFKQALLEALAEPADDLRRIRRVDVAKENSWDARAEDICRSLGMLDTLETLEESDRPQMQTWSTIVSRSFIKEIEFLKSSNTKNLQERDLHWRREFGRLLGDLDRVK